MSNFYTIVDFPETNKTYGKYSGNKPKQCAEQAFMFLVNQIGNNFKNNADGKFIVFTIKNIKTNIEYKYIGTVIKLENPKKNYIYKNVISRYNPKLNYLYNLE
jgi:hypothetical protein